MIRSSSVLVGLPTIFFFVIIIMIRRLGFDRNSGTLREPSGSLLVFFFLIRVGFTPLKLDSVVGLLYHFSRRLFAVGFAKRCVSESNNIVVVLSPSSCQTSWRQHSCIVTPGRCVAAQLPSFFFLLLLGQCQIGGQARDLNDPLRESYRTVCLSLGQENCINN